MAAVKPKIDLKARLGRKSAAPSAAPPAAAPPAAAPPAAAPPAAAPPAAFAPSAAPPAAAPAFAPPGVAKPAAGIQAPVGGASIPPPPGFGAKPAAAARPAPAPAAAPVAAAPAGPITIKMDLGEEVVEARAANKKKAMMVGLAGLVAGLGFGFIVGTGVKGNEGAKAAIEGAEALIKEIDAANIKVTELDDILRNAASKVKSGEFPSKEIESLGGLDIPFDGMNLTNKGIGRFNPTAVTMLLQYANGVSRAKEQRDKIRRIFGAAKATFDKIAEEKKTPKVHWGAVFGSGAKGPWVTLKPVKAFELKKDWPKELAKVKRYAKGDPNKGDSVILPVNPGSETAVCPTNLKNRLMGALMDLGKSIKGDQTPGREVQGLLELGDKVSDQLRKIGGPG